MLGLINSRRSYETVDLYSQGILYKPGSISSNPLSKFFSAFINISKLNGEILKSLTIKFFFKNFRNLIWDDWSKY